MKQNNGTPIGSRDTTTTVLENGSSSKEDGNNADASPAPKSADRGEGDSMQPTTGNDELAGGRGQDPKGEPAGERREDGQQKRHVPSPGAEKGGSSKAKLVISTSAGGGPEKGSSPTNKVRNSKKRSREESASPMQQRLDEDVSQTVLSSAGARSPSESVAADGGEEAIKAPAAAESGAGDDGMEVVEEGTPAARESLSRPGALKPLEDPQVNEVVLQDLATQEIRRVRRKQNDSPSGISGSQAGAGTSKLAEGQRDAVGGDAEIEAQAATPAPASTANGSKPLAAKANGKAELQRENEPDVPLGAVDENREGELAAAGGGEAGGGGGDGDGVRGEGRAAPTPVAAKTPNKQPNGVAAQAAERSRDPTAVRDPATAPAAEPVTPSSERRTESAAAAAALTAPTTKNPATSSSEALQGKETVGDKPAGSDVSARPEAGGGAEQNTEPEPMDEDGREDEERKEGESVRAGDKGKEEEEDGQERGEGSSASKARSVQCPAHALPVARTFFDYASVSSFEMRMLPEFFTGRSPSKTPEMYMQSRNFMVRSYQRMLEADKDGQAYLTGTECRRKLAGDACSTLRIHDFLNRFGLINTRTGGKRPPSYPVPPPAVHLWNPTPAAAPFARETAAPTSTLERDFRQQETSGGGIARARGGVVGGWGQDSAVAQRDASGSGDLAWHRQELTRLMEAAVANPDQWEVVAQLVGGGRSPAACMRRFLNLAVEELLVEDREEEKQRRPSATAKFAAPAVGVVPPTTPAPEAGPMGDAAHAAVMAVGVDVSPALSTGDTVAATPMSLDAPTPGEDLVSMQKPDASKRSIGSGASTGADKGVHRSVGDRERKRPAYLGPEAPALMLASALVSSVHPEVLEAAMSAAVAAADDVARRSAAAAAPRAPGGVTDDRVGVQRGGGGHLPGVAGGRRLEGAEGRNDEDVEMRDVVTQTGGEGRERIKEAGLGTAVASGGREADEAVEEESGVEVERQATRAGAARAAVLSVAGLQARGLAELEERRTEMLVSDLVEARVQRLETKLHCLDELDKVLETERQSLEHDRAELLAGQARSMVLK